MWILIERMFRGTKKENKEILFEKEIFKKTLFYTCFGKSVINEDKNKFNNN